jgi:hypothetical protein
MKICTSTIFSSKTRTVADALIQVINHDLAAYQPLTVRQCYYQLVGRQIIPNNLSQYSKVSRVLVQLREEGLVPWAAIEDRTRRTTDKRGVSSVTDWLDIEARALFNPGNYGRCLVQGQTVHVEITTEKDALAAILEDVVYPYCVRLNVVRGQVSATMVEQIARRFDQAIMDNKRPVLIHFGDLDPSGVAIPKALQRNLADRHGIDAEVLRAALNPDQVDLFALPGSPDAVKSQDPNHGAWLREYGPAQSAVELDALHPKDLQDILRAALNGVFDMEDFAAQKQREIHDRELIKEIRRYALACVGRRYGNEVPFAADYAGGQI